MGVLITKNGELKMEYPDHLTGFGTSKVKQLLGISVKENIETLTIKNGRTNLLKFWFDNSIKPIAKNLNAKASVMSMHFENKYMYGDVLIEGDVLAIFDDLNIEI